MNQIMARRFIQVVLIFYLLPIISSTFCLTFAEAIDRTSFPAGFIFGAGSSAYQIEGEAFSYGKGISIWDTFTRVNPEKIEDHTNGIVADEFYNYFKEDIALVKEIGFDSFRLSVSWPRIFPHGKISKGLNKEGVKFYNDLIDELVANDIKPMITLFHWDLPQELEDQYGGFLSPRILKDYTDYVDYCFKEFGDRVKHWLTFNEPNLFSVHGYASGVKAPGRCSDCIGNCTSGNSATEPYIVAHHFLLCHANAVKLYRDKYQASQRGEIGLVLNIEWMVPKFDTVASENAALRELDFSFGWFAHPITYGEYPKSMQDLVGNRLPKFTEAESKLVKGSFDFIGVNYYTAKYADDYHFINTTDLCLSYTTDARVNITVEKNGIPIGTPTASRWLYVYPKGIYNLMLYVKERFNNPPIYITENGFSDPKNNSIPIQISLNDNLRISYHFEHLSYLLASINEGGADVRGYYVWSFLDDFEWEFGFTVRFGITYIDYGNWLRRYLKKSAFWFKLFLQDKKEDNTTTVTTTPLLFSD